MESGSLVGLCEKAFGSNLFLLPRNHNRSIGDIQYTRSSSNSTDTIGRLQGIGGCRDQSPGSIFGGRGGFQIVCAYHTCQGTRFSGCSTNRCDSGPTDRGSSDHNSKTCGSEKHTHASHEAINFSLFTLLMRKNLILETKFNRESKIVQTHPGTM